MTEIILASSNKGKISEIEELLKNVNIRIIPLDQVGIREEIPETANTIKGNAVAKADYVYRKIRVNVLADDTGLETEALNGAPGVYSARYASDEKNDKENVKKLLQELEGETNRSARFVTWLALYLNGEIFTFQGLVEGEITTSPRGEKGFGYDAVFMPSGSNKTFAEMAAAEKNRISHRGRAMQKLLHFLGSIH